MKREAIMQILRCNRKPIAFAVVMALTFFCTVISPVQAALVTTNEVINQSKSDIAREKVNIFLERADVQQQMVAMGVNPDMAKSRVASLTDQEIMQLSDRIDQLPAGSGTFETILIIGLVFFLVLVVLDIVGVTDVFPFIK
jgi:hypothetical protein